MTRRSFKSSASSAMCWRERSQIAIPNCARLSLLLRRAPAEGSLTPEWREKMARIDQCLHCGQCAGRCPYGLDTPELLRRNYEDYKTFLK